MRATHSSGSDSHSSLFPPHRRDHKPPVPLFVQTWAEPFCEPQTFCNFRVNCLLLWQNSSSASTSACIVQRPFSRATFYRRIEFTPTTHRNLAGPLESIPLRPRARAISHPERQELNRHALPLPHQRNAPSCRIDILSKTASTFPRIRRSSGRVLRYTALLWRRQIFPLGGACWACFMHIIARH